MCRWLFQINSSNVLYKYSSAISYWQISRENLFKSFHKYKTQPRSLGVGWWTWLDGESNCYDLDQSLFMLSHIHGSNVVQLITKLYTGFAVSYVLVFRSDRTSSVSSITVSVVMYGLDKSNKKWTNQRIVGEFCGQLWWIWVNAMNESTKWRSIFIWTQITNFIHIW